MFNFNMRVSSTHLMHPLCSDPLLDQSVNLPNNPSPPVHSSLSLSAVAGVKGMQECCFNHISLLLHLLHLLHLVELLHQLPWVVKLLHRRGSGGDASALKQRRKQARVRGWGGDLGGGTCACVGG